MSMQFSFRTGKSSPHLFSIIAGACSFQPLQRRLRSRCKPAWRLPQRSPGAKAGIGTGATSSTMVKRLVASILVATAVCLAPVVAAGEDLLTVNDFAGSILVLTRTGCNESISTAEVVGGSFSGSRQCNSTDSLRSQVGSSAMNVTVSASGIFVDGTSSLNLSATELSADILVLGGVSVRFTVHQPLRFEAAGFTRASASQPNGFETIQRTRATADIFFSEDEPFGVRFFGREQNIVLTGEDVDPSQRENTINRDGILFPGTYRMIVSADLEGTTPRSSSRTFTATAEARVSLNMPFTPVIPCCSPTGRCNELTVEECASSGGIPSGEPSCDDSACFLPTGACCIGAECTQRNEAACLNRGGTYFGDGSSCNDADCCPEKGGEECPDTRGACCLGESPNKTCEFIERDKCRERGGVFRGVEVECEDTACDCDVFWSGAPTGNFDDEDNWIGGEVPRDVEVGCQNAFFDAGTVSLSFGTHSLNGLFLRGNQSRLELSGDVLNLSGRASIEEGFRTSLGIGSSTRLVIERGVINTNNALIGDTFGEFGGTIELRGAGSTLNIANELHVGELVNGFVNLDGGTITSDTALIGSPSGRIGVLSIIGDGSFQADLLRLGDTGNGSVSVLGGIVTARELRVGNGVPPAGTPNSSLAVNGEIARVVTTGELLLGAIGRGDMRIENGGRVQAATLTLGGLGGDVGTALITGRVDAQFASRAEAGTFSVGFESDGDLTVEQGGRFASSGSGVVGDQGLGVFRVRGVHPPTGEVSTLEVGEDFIVGRNGFGVVTLSAAAQARVKRDLIVGAGSDEGILNVRDAALTVDREAIIGDFGGGTLEVIGLGVVVITGNATLGREGTGSGSVIVERGDSLTATPTVDFGADCRVGASGTGLLRIEVGGLARVRGALRISNGLVELRGERGADPPVLDALDGITIGDGIAPGRLTLTGNARVFSTLVVIDAAGFVNQSPGSLITGQIVNGGFITVSGSAGKQDEGPALIDGNLEMLPGGVLRVEAGGEGPALRVTGNISLAGTLEIVFPEGFEPTQGQSLELFLVDGDTEGAFATLSAPERDGFAATVDVVDGIARASIDDPGTPRETEGEGVEEGEGEGEGLEEGEGDTEGEGELEGEGAEEGEGEGEDETPVGCGGCSGCDQGKTAPFFKHLGDWFILGAAGGLLLLLHRRRLDVHGRAGHA